MECDSKISSLSNEMGEKITCYPHSKTNQTKDQNSKNGSKLLKNAILNHPKPMKEVGSNFKNMFFGSHFERTSIVSKKNTLNQPPWESK